MKEKNTFFDRITQIIEFKGIKSVNEFALNYLNYDAPQKINRLKQDGKNPSYEIILDIVNKFEEINPEWLLTGNGSMLKEGKNIDTNPVASFRKTVDAIHEVQRVPLFNLEATMGLIPLMDNNGLDSEAIIDYLSIPNLASCDGAIYATGDSMYPLLKSGDIIAYKKISLDSIFWGEMYIIAIHIDEQNTYKTIKFVQKSDLGDDHIKLVSQNQHHQPMDILRSKIAAIALIRASIRIHN